MVQIVPVTVERVVDGDTVRVILGGRAYPVRVQALDTEESNPGGTKPVTPWGMAASNYVKALLPAGSAVGLVLDSDAPLYGPDGKIAVDHLDNYNRVLGRLDLATPTDDGGPATADFQELMIRLGFSPYFVKYGRVPDPAADARYAAAERTAQARDIGVWNQALVNGSVFRNYPRLAAWWELRATLVDGFRAARQGRNDLLNSRLDYAELTRRAAAGETVTVFLELRSMRPAGSHAILETGSLAQPFSVFIPAADSPERREVVTLVANRYLSDNEDEPRRNYAYITGRLALHRARPEVVLEAIAQVSDAAPPLPGA
jgi:micrococcal nuclease